MSTAIHSAIIEENAVAAYSDCEGCGKKKKMD